MLASVEVMQRMPIEELLQVCLLVHRKDRYRIGGKQQCEADLADDFLHELTLA